MRRYKNAIRDRNVQVEGHRGFTENIGLGAIQRWETICVEWERDPFPKKKPSPYMTKSKSMTEAQVRKELTDEHEERLARGEAAVHETSASGFLVLGLELEEAQYVVSYEISCIAHVYAQTTPQKTFQRPT